MVDSYATPDDLAARLSPGYAAPDHDDAVKLLAKASELVDYTTLGRAQAAWSKANPPSPDALLSAITTATCDQVEFWLEVGEEHDVLGLPRGSSLQGGRVQVQKIPGQLGQRAKRGLVAAGLLWAGGSIA